MPKLTRSVAACCPSTAASSRLLLPSRIPIVTRTTSLGQTSTSSSSSLQPRSLSLMAHKPPPPFFSPDRSTPKRTDPALSPESEVDDREWEMRVARAMLHLRETLPLLFDNDTAASDLFPADVYSKNVVLQLPHPLPLKISSLSGYAMAFGIARNGMQALHSDLNTTLERMTFTPAPAPGSKTEAARRALLGDRAPPSRQRQIRVLLRVNGQPRLPPHKEATWHTSSVYTFSPYSGLIATHEVETIRPLPGEGVAEWLMNNLLGWTGRQGEAEGVVVPRVQGEAVGYERR